jgi:hypothetical protein
MKEFFDIRLLRIVTFIFIKNNVSRANNFTLLGGLDTENDSKVIANQVTD